jgi:hypothetical protein
MSSATYMRFAPLSVSLAGTIAILSAVIAGATIWLLMTDPVTVADAVESGEVSPLVRQIATVLYNALAGLLKYL